MPAACPSSSGAPRSLAAERLGIARREALETLQAQQTMAQRQALVRGVTPIVSPPTPVYQPAPSNPYMPPLAPPDFRAAAQVIGNAVSGSPHN